MKIGATRVDHDVKLAVAAGADVVVVDGMQGGTAATQDVFIEHAGIPTLPAVRMAAEALRDIGMRDEVQLIVSGGIRSGADVAKALGARRRRRLHRGRRAPGPGLQPRHLPRRTRARRSTSAPTTPRSGTAPGRCAHCHTGRCPVGITTQDAALEARLDPVHAATAVANYLRALTMEVTALARACGKSSVHHLEPEDLAALTVEAAAMARVPLAGTDWIPGWPT